MTRLDIAGATLTLTLQPPVKEGETVTLEYTEPELSPLRDATANRVGGFERVLVNRTDTTPRVEAATANGTALLILFDQPLDEGSTPGPQAFSVTGGPLVSGVDIDGATLHLTLEPRAQDGAELRVTYMGSSDHPLQDATLHQVEPFEIDVVNETDDAPTALSASTDMSGATITIVTSESVTRRRQRRAGCVHPRWISGASCSRSRRRSEGYRSSSSRQCTSWMSSSSATPRTRRSPC